MFTTSTLAWTTLLAIGAFPRVIAAQNPRSAIARPGSGLIVGAVITPSRREFTITSSTGCELDTAGPRSLDGSLIQETRVIEGTELLFIQEWREPDSPVVDTTALDRRTLAPLWNHAHFQHDASASWEFRGQRVLWSIRQPGGETESLDSTFDERAFLAGTVSLLLTATPALYRSNAPTAFSFIDVHGDPGEPSFLAVYTAAARVTGSEVVTLPSGRRVDSWVVRTEPDERTYWIDKRTHEPLMWLVPQYESICPMTYLRSSP